MTDQQRDRILACACELYLKGGLEGFSMRKLARAVGVTAPALYRHFESRDHVLQEVVADAYRRFANHLYRALEGRTPLERFRLAGEGYLDFALGNPRLFDVLFAAPDHIGWESLPHEIEAQACAIGQFWCDRVRECMDAGILKPAGADDISVTLWGHAHGLMTLYLRGLLPPDEERFRELYHGSFRRLMAGLATHEFEGAGAEEEVAASEAAASAGAASGPAPSDDPRVGG